MKIDANIFSNYFLETRDKVEIKLCGEWLKHIDLDTVEFMYSVFVKIKDSGCSDPYKMMENPEIRESVSDLVLLCKLIVQWETKVLLMMDDAEDVERISEYFFRFATLIQSEYYSRIGLKVSEIMVKDSQHYNGKLAIYEE
jgi:hypothetical protein